MYKSNKLRKLKIYTRTKRRSNRRSSKTRYKKHHKKVKYNGSYKRDFKGGYKGGYKICDKHKIFIRNPDRSVNKEYSLKGTINKFNCYQTILNDPSQTDIHAEARRQYDELIQFLIDNFYSGKDIFLKYLIKDDRYKSLSDDELKILLIPLTRMQEDAIPPSMPIIDYILRERKITLV